MPQPPPDPQTDKVVAMFWRSFPDRKSASCTLAAISLMVNKIGAAQTIDVMRRLSGIIERNERNSVFSYVGRTDNAFIVCNTDEDVTTSAPTLERLMDMLVGELRSIKGNKQQAPANSSKVETKS